MITHTTRPWQTLPLHRTLTNSSTTDLASQTNPHKRLARERSYLPIETMSGTGESRGLRVLALGTRLSSVIEVARTADLDQMAVGSEDYPR